jgi:hypothetical protein
MIKIKNRSSILRLFLYLTALHSFVVGIGLILITNQLRLLLGFSPSQEQFFQTQSGVFHIIMATAYFLSGYNIEKYRQMFIFSIFVKFCASIFLFTYLIVISFSYILFFSGFVDLIIFLIMFYFYKTEK